MPKQPKSCGGKKCATLFLQKKKKECWISRPKGDEASACKKNYRRNQSGLPGLASRKRRGGRGHGQTTPTGGSRPLREKRGSIRKRCLEKNDAGRAIEKNRSAPVRRSSEKKGVEGPELFGAEPWAANRPGEKRRAFQTQSSESLNP